MICCKELVTKSSNLVSPFRRMLSTGYYDGPTEGFMECYICKETYVFSKLDWDDEQDIRIFSIAPVNMSWSEIIDNTVPEHNLNCTFAIVPFLIGKYKSFVDDRLSLPTAQIAAAYDLQKEFLFWQLYTGEKHINEIDWFSRLGIPRNSGK
jgi:hypothetical protein